MARTGSERPKGHRRLCGVSWKLQPDGRYLATFYKATDRGHGVASPPPVTVDRVQVTAHAYEVTTNGAWTAVELRRPVLDRAGKYAGRMEPQDVWALVTREPGNTYPGPAWLDVLHITAGPYIAPPAVPSPLMDRLHGRSPTP